MVAGCNLCLMAILCVPVTATWLLKTKSTFPTMHGKTFFTLHVSSVDASGGGETKANGLLPLVLESLSQRVARYLPTNSAYQLRCVASADHITGTPARGAYDVMLPAGDGPCVAPNLHSLSLFLCQFASLLTVRVLAYHGTAM